MLTDIFITTHKRSDLFRQSYRSFLENTDREDYRLTVVIDEGNDNLNIVKDTADYVLYNRNADGLGPVINHALGHIKLLNDYGKKVSEFTCMCQDDILYEKDWLKKLLKVYKLFKARQNLGFVTGHNAPEHHTNSELRFGKDKLLLKPWIRATQMLTETNYFTSMLPIPLIDPETRRERGRPNDGLGSGVDWHFVRVHPNSVCKTGRVNLVYPGLIKHIGYNKSTWLDRDLPEDD